MRKRMTILVGVAALLLLGGVGCFNQPEQTNNFPPPPPAAENRQTAKEEFTLTVENTGPGLARLRWTAPTEMDVKDGFRLLYGGRPGTDRPFWYWQAGDQREAVWGVPSGKKYFRVCQWLGEECGQYSNEVELEVE